MRMIHLGVTAIAALGVGFAGASAMTASRPILGKQARAASTAPLRPLSDADQQRTHETGCQLSFNTARNTLVYAIGHDFMVRTRAGLQVCRINDRQFSALSGGGTRSCGGARINIRRTGRSVGNPASDSASMPAVLTVTGQGRPWSVRGYWGTAC